MDEATGVIHKIESVYAPEHLPIGILVKNNTVDHKSLNEWWTERSIPASRTGVREALDIPGLTDTKLLLVRCYGLNLSDQYWISPDSTSDGNLKKRWKIIDGQLCLVKGGSNPYRQQKY